MIRRTPRRRRVSAIKNHFRQIERIDKHLDHANRVAFVNEIIEAFGQQRRLPTIRLFNEAPHQLLPQNHERNQQRFHTARVKSCRRDKFNTASGLPAAANITAADALFGLAPKHRYLCLEPLRS